MKNTKRDRILYFDVLNILACIAVITMHHNGLVHHFEDSLAWKESLIPECTLYQAVPVFLMISGANLLNYREKYSTVVFFEKRILRTVIPWLLWSIIMLIWKTGTGQMEAGYTIMEYIDQILNYKVETIYWFFGALFACYLAMPVFSLIVQNRNLLWYTVAVNFIFLSCIPALKTLLGFSWSLDVPVVGSLMIYVLLGYLLATEKMKRCQRIAIYVLGASGFLFRLIYTYNMSMRNGTTDVSMKGYAMFHTVFLSVAVFVWAKQVSWRKYLPKGLIERIPRLSSYSFGVYLLHKIVMYYERELFNLDIKSHIWRIGMIPVTYVLTLGIVHLLKKIPYFGKVVC